jgi:endonuclease G
MEYDTAQRHTVWVAYVFNNYYNQKNVNRSNAWAFDPIIPQQFQSLNSTSQTFSQWGYDRGHLIASEDRVFSLDANRETFYYSNMSPQVSAFNQGIWANLEGLLRKWAQASDCDTLYVVTGGAINSGVQIIGKLENRNNVTVPKYYFKALVKRKGNSFDGIAFWMENKRYDNNRVTHEYSVTIRQLEQLTGINFFPNLKYTIPGNPALEQAVETTRDVTKWPL